MLHEERFDAQRSICAENDKVGIHSLTTTAYQVIDHDRSRKRNPLNMNEDSGDIAEMLFDENGSWNKEVRSAIRQPLDREDFWQILKNCLEALPNRQADVFTLRAMDEKKAEEICKELEITSTNYWVILHRARLQLSSCMKQRWFEESN